MHFVPASTLEEVLRVALPSTSTTEKNEAAAAEVMP